MTDNPKQRSFPEYARLLSKEPGWGDTDDVLQELLGGFLRGRLEVTWPRGDVPSGPGGVHLMTIRHELAHGPDMGPNPSIRRVNVPVKTPPQEAVSRDEWLQAFHAFGEQDPRMGADWSLLADIPISEYPPLFRQAYIDWLHTTDAALGQWLKGYGRAAPGWLQDGVGPVALAPEEPKKKAGCKPGRPTFVSEMKGDYRALEDAGEVDFNAPKTTLYKAIRKRICNRHNDIAIDMKGRPRGLGDEAMRRAVTPLWEADLEKARQQGANKPAPGPSKL